MKRASIFLGLTVLGTVVGFVIWPHVHWPSSGPRKDLASTRSPVRPARNPAGRVPSKPRPQTETHSISASDQAAGAYFSPEGAGAKLRLYLSLYLSGKLDSARMLELKKDMKVRAAEYMREITVGLGVIPAKGHDLERQFLLDLASRLDVDLNERMALLKKEVSYLIPEGPGAGATYSMSALAAFDGIIEISGTGKTVRRVFVDTLVALPDESPEGVALINRYATFDPAGAASVRRTLATAGDSTLPPEKKTKLIYESLSKVDSSGPNLYVETANGNEN